MRALATSLCCVAAHEAYLALNPNGYTSAALGHVDASSPGVRNEYGKAFDAASKQYSAALCALDSDKDGFSNGFEMGDECCLWSTAPDCPADVLVTEDLSYPGDKTSFPKRTVCTCDANNSTRRCACCGLSPCGPGGGGGGDDDDDDVPTWVWFAAGGGGVAVAAAVGAWWCVLSRRKKSRAAEGYHLPREEESTDLYATLN